MALQDEQSISQMADILEGKVAPPPIAPSVVEPPAPVSQEQQPSDTPAPTVPNPTPNTPETAKTEQPQYNFDEELVKITNGGVKSQTELADLLSRANQLNDFESKLKVYEEENTSLKAKVNTDPFANDFTKKLNELYKAGANDDQIQAFTTLNKVKDLDGLSPVDAKMLALQIKHGLSADEAKNYLNATYKLNPDENDEETVKAENIRLKVDSASDKDFLKSHKAEVSKLPENPAEQQQRQLQQEQVEHIAKLEPIAKNIVNEATNYFKGMSINGKDGDQAITVDFPVSEESLKSLQQGVEGFIQANWNNLPANEKGVEQIKAFAQNVLAIQNYKNWIINSASEREKQVRAEYNNPTPIQRGPDAPNPGKSNKEQMDKFVLDNYV